MMNLIEIEKEMNWLGFDVEFCMICWNWLGIYEIEV